MLPVGAIIPTLKGLLVHAAQRTSLPPLLVRPVTPLTFHACLFSFSCSAFRERRAAFSDSFLDLGLFFLIWFS